MQPEIVRANGATPNSTSALAESATSQTAAGGTNCTYNTPIDVTDDRILQDETHTLISSTAIPQEGFCEKMLPLSTLVCNLQEAARGLGVSPSGSGAQEQPGTVYNAVASGQPLADQPHLTIHHQASSGHMQRQIRSARPLPRRHLGRRPIQLLEEMPADGSTASPEHRSEPTSPTGLHGAVRPQRTSSDTISRPRSSSNVVSVASNNNNVGNADDFIVMQDQPKSSAATASQPNRTAPSQNRQQWHAETGYLQTASPVWHQSVCYPDGSVWSYENITTSKSISAPEVLPTATTTPLRHCLSSASVLSNSTNAWRVPPSTSCQPPILSHSNQGMPSAVTGQHAFVEAQQRITDDTTRFAQEDDRCEVCLDLYPSEGNEIVYCDGCNLAVHQQCYGIGNVPDGTWYCSLCDFIFALNGRINTLENQRRNVPPRRGIGGVQSSIAQSPVCGPSVTSVGLLKQTPPPISSSLPPSQSNRTPDRAPGDNGVPGGMLVTNSQSICSSSVHHHSSSRSIGRRPSSAVIPLIVDSVVCALCLKSRGPMRCGPEGKWVHVSCVLYTKDGPYFINPGSLNQPVSIQKYINLNKRKGYSCCFCNSACGCTTRCLYPDCTRRFHVTCAQQRGVLPKLELVGDYPLEFFIRVTVCDKHDAPEYRKRVREVEFDVMKCDERRRRDTRKAVGPVGRPPRPLSTICSPAGGGFYGGGLANSSSTHSRKASSGKSSRKANAPLIPLKSPEHERPPLIRNLPAAVALSDAEMARETRRGGVVRRRPRLFELRHREEPVSVSAGFDTEPDVTKPRRTSTRRGVVQEEAESSIADEDRGTADGIKRSKNLPAGRGTRVHWSRHDHLFQRIPLSLGRSSPLETIQNSRLHAREATEIYKFLTDTSKVPTTEDLSKPVNKPQFSLDNLFKVWVKHLEPIAPGVKSKDMSNSLVETGNGITPVSSHQLYSSPYTALLTIDNPKTRRQLAAWCLWKKQLKTANDSVIDERWASLIDPEWARLLSAPDANEEIKAIGGMLQRMHTGANVQPGDPPGALSVASKDHIFGTDAPTAEAPKEELTKQHGGATCVSTETERMVGVERDEVNCRETSASCAENDYNKETASVGRTSRECPDRCDTTTNEETDVTQAEQSDDDLKKSIIAQAVSLSLVEYVPLTYYQLELIELIRRKGGVRFSVDESGALHISECIQSNPCTIGGGSDHTQPRLIDTSVGGFIWKTNDDEEDFVDVQTASWLVTAQELHVEDGGIKSNILAQIKKKKVPTATLR